MQLARGERLTRDPQLWYFSQSKDVCVVTIIHRAFLDPDERLTVPFRVDLTWCVLHVSFNYRGLTTKIPTIRRRGNASRFRDEMWSENWMEKLATPQENSQLGKNRPNSILQVLQ